MSLRIRELPPEDRPREKLARLGSQALSESEMLAILLSTGRKGQNVVDLARHLLLRFGSLGALSRASVRDLEAIDGIGPAKACQIAAAFGLGQRLTAEMLIRTRIDSPELVYGLLGAEMQALTKESLRAVLLDTRYHMIKIAEISLGSLNESIAHPREVFEAAIRHNAFAFILVHNHPSGDPTPSEADHRLTRRLADAAQLLQIGLLDHVIIGQPSATRKPFYSFKEHGVL